MKYQIVSDSSCNLTSDYIKDENIGFSVAPLSIFIDDVEYVDNDELDVENLIKVMHSSKGKAHTSCPSPNAYLEEFNKSEFAVCFTISSKLSGSYNSAILAKNMSDKPENVIVIDSKATAGSLELLIDYAYELLKQDLEFSKVEELLTKKRDELNLLFVLDNFNNLVKNGRMNKIVAAIATAISIKPLCIADNGEIKIKEKIRSLHGVLKRLAFNIGKLSENNSDKKIVICHTNNLICANFLKDLIKETYDFKEIMIRENRGLCGFYSEEGGIIVSF